MYGPSLINNNVAVRKKRAEEAKESREAKDKSYENCPWTELTCKDVTKLKKLCVPELNKYLNHYG